MPPNDPRYPDANNNDVILTDGQYALLRDNTKGSVAVLVGPTLATLSGRQQTPVTWDPNSRSYKEVPAEGSVRPFVTIMRNQYAVLENPTNDPKQAHPSRGMQQAIPDLAVGEAQVIPGPTSFALWPGQSSTVIDGHRLRFNEFLLIEVIDEDAAKKNWKSAVMKVADQKPPQQATQLQTNSDGTPTPDAPPVALLQPASISVDVPKDLAVGQQYLVKGTDVRFYIPPTGVRVVQDENGRYVRQALTLEIMEYCILVDENGTKTFPRGPAVVFPNPTQKFVVDPDSGNRSFRPIELNPIQGLHLKALADHEFRGEQIKEGTEFFLTGKDVQIYYPNPNHAQVKYDGQAKSYATSVPKGESRYVLDRNSGEVELVLGPTMLLPNPVTHVLVRRVLTDGECSLWYPGNTEAMAYNAALREQAKQTPTTRAGTVSEGQVARSRSPMLGTKGLSMMESSHVSNSGINAPGEEIDRKSTYNAPRTITLDSKYAGAPVIIPSPGYAVLVVSKSGNRKVIRAGERHHLAYDETLQPFVFSTGRPKSGKNQRKDVYLRAANNAVRDEIEVLTADHVKLNIYVSLRVGFTGDTQEEMLKWWAVENYVKFLTDHVRSRMKAAIRQIGFSEFYAKSAEYIRNILLGEVVGEGAEAKRKGLFFSDNNLNVYDVEVLEVNIADATIAGQLNEAMRKTVVSELTLSQDRVRVGNLKEQAALQQVELGLRDEMAERENAVKLNDLKRRAAMDEATREQQTARQEYEIEYAERADDSESELHTSRLARQKAADDQSLAFDQEKQKLEIALIEANTKAATMRFKAVEGQLTQALVALGDKRTLVDLADATSLQRFVGGKNVKEAFKDIFGDNISTLLGGLSHRAFLGGPQIDRGSKQENGHA